MIRYLGAGFIVVFWVAMNVLLYRSEFQGALELGATVQPGLVWKKILEAPDHSSMDIFKDGEKIGYCRWVPTIGEPADTMTPSIDETFIEGKVDELTGYFIQLEGSWRLPGKQERFRFEFDGRFSTNLVWREMQLQAGSADQTVQLETSAVDETLQVSIAAGGAPWERTFTFEDLSDPRKLMREFGLLAPLGLLAQPLAEMDGAPGALSLGIEWTARNDWLEIGQSQARVYRLEARLLNQHRLVVIVSRVGELLRVEAPGEILLQNEALVTW